jgi:hypothetical protein
VAKRLARSFAFGRSWVLIPGPPDLVFFKGFLATSHRGMSTGLISQIRRMLGQYLLHSIYHLPSAPILTAPIQNLAFCVTEKALESLSKPPSLGQNEKCIFLAILSPRLFSFFIYRPSSLLQISSLLPSFPTPLNLIFLSYCRVDSDFCTS